MSDSPISESDEHPITPAAVGDFKDISTEELCAKVKEPTTLLEILVNIKFAMDHDLLLRSDFFDEQRLMHLFGAEKVEVKKPKIETPFYVVNFVMSGFSKLILPTVRGKNHTGTTDFSLVAHKVHKQSRLAEGSIHWISASREPSLVLENMISVLGSPTKLGFDPMTHQNLDSPPPWPQVKTHRHGGDTAQYSIKTHQVERSMVMTLYPDGTLCIGFFRAQRRVPEG
jgi:hypothetical protein